MKNVVVVGSQWGDEGKGKIVDWLSEKLMLLFDFKEVTMLDTHLVIDGVTYKLRLLPLELLEKIKFQYWKWCCC